MRYGRLAPIGLLLAVHAWVYRGFDIDDAFIVFRFVRQWAGGNGLVYNVGERVEGYSSILWVVLLAPFELAGIDLVVASKALGLVFAFATLIATARLASRFAMPEIAPLFLAASAPFAAWAMGGLETTLFTCILTLCAVALVHEQESGRGWLSGLLLGLLALTRPEGMLFAGVAVVFRAWNLHAQRARPDGYDALRCLVFLGVVVPYYAWRTWYYGAPLPNTVYAKAMGFHLRGPLEGAYYLYLSAREIGGFLFLALPVGLALTWARDSQVVRLCLVGVTVYAGAVLVGGGDFMPVQRLLVHVLPLVYVLIHAGIVQLDRVWPPRSAPVAVLALVVGQAGFLLAMSLDHRIVAAIADSSLAPVYTPTTRYMRAHLAPGETVAVVDAGKIAYILPLQSRVVDMIGLTDAHIARRPADFPNGLLGRGDGFGKWDVDYVLAQKPRFVHAHIKDPCAPGAWQTDFTGTTLLLNDPRFTASYRLVGAPEVRGLFERIAPE